MPLQKLKNSLYTMNECRDLRGCPGPDVVIFLENVKIMYSSCFYCSWIWHAVFSVRIWVKNPFWKVHVSASGLMPKLMTALLKTFYTNVSIYFWKWGSKISILHKSNTNSVWGIRLGQFIKWANSHSLPHKIT